MQTRKLNRRERRASHVGAATRARVVIPETGPFKDMQIVAEPKDPDIPEIGELLIDDIAEAQPNPQDVTEDIPGSYTIYLLGQVGSSGASIIRGLHKNRFGHVDLGEFGVNAGIAAIEQRRLLSLQNDKIIGLLIEQNSYLAHLAGMLDEELPQYSEEDNANAARDQRAAST